MSGRVIRPGVGADADGIGKAQTASWQQGYQGLFAQEFLDALRWERRAEFWRSMLPLTQAVALAQDPLLTHRVLVAEESGEIHGFVAFGPCRNEMPVSPDSIELTALYVTQEHWGDGTATALVDALLDTVPAHATIALWVLEGNVRGRRFYEKSGFTATSKLKIEEIDGSPITQLMYLRAAPAAA